MEDVFKSGLIFIAYKGTEFKDPDITKALNEKCKKGYTVRSLRNDGLVFSKIVPEQGTEDEKEPFWSIDNRILTVSGYNQIEMGIACNKFPEYKIKEKHQLVNFLYVDHGIEMFKILSQYLNFCSVLWIQETEELIAGITTPNSNRTHLFFGYTKKNNEIMYSNNKEILEQFCKNITEVKENTIMKNGKCYDLDGEAIDQQEKFIRKNKDNAGAILDRLNELLINVTNVTVIEEIEKIIKTYFASEEPKAKIEKCLSEELNEETKSRVLNLVKDIINECKLEDNIREKIKTLLDYALAEYKKEITLPTVHIIKLNETIVSQVSGEFYHEAFEQILSQTQLDEPIMLIGPAGSGKNVAVLQVSKALNQHMYYANNVSNEFKLTGFIDAGGHYRETQFYKAFKNGGVFMLDEIDNSDPSALIVINSALANGYMAFPHDTIDRHPDFRIIAAANTWGKGSDLQYVGRNPLDGATLDRFDDIYFEYDKKLEAALYPKEDVLQFMWAFREAVYRSKISHIVSTRGIGKVYRKDINNIPIQNILTSNVVKSLRQDDLNAIIGNMSELSSENKYYQAIKKLSLKR